MESDKKSYNATAFVERVSANAEVGYVAAKGISRVGEKKRGKYAYEALQGYEFNMVGQLIKKERIIDRKNNKYKEVVTNVATGEVIRDVAHPLSAHTGQGSARNSKETP